MRALVDEYWTMWAHLVRLRALALSPVALIVVAVVL